MSAELQHQTPRLNRSLIQPRVQTSPYSFKGKSTATPGRTLHIMGPEEAESILDTQARNDAFKINMPHS